MTNCVHECTTITSTRVLPGSSTSVHTGTLHTTLLQYTRVRKKLYIHVPFFIYTVQFNFTLYWVPHVRVPYYVLHCQL